MLSWRRKWRKFGGLTRNGRVISWSEVSWKQALWSSYGLKCFAPACLFPTVRWFLARWQINDSGSFTPQLAQGLTHPCDAKKNRSGYLWHTHRHGVFLWFCARLALAAEKSSLTVAVIKPPKINTCGSRWYKGALCRFIQTVTVLCLCYQLFSKFSAPVEPATPATSHFQPNFLTVRRFCLVGFNPKPPIGSIWSREY